jgi:hypothetical protein
MIFCGDIGWLVKEINGRLEKIWAKTGLFAKEIKAVCK